jgi:hypothetical protein
MAKKSVEENEIEDSPKSGRVMKPIEWAKEKGVSDVIIAGAFIKNDNLMTVEEFVKILDKWLNIPAAY